MFSNVKETVLVIAPHPDDETFGCGGTLLRHQHEGDGVHWLIVTSMEASADFSSVDCAIRSSEIDAVAARFNFSSTTKLTFPPAGLDVVPRAQLVRAIAAAVHEVRPTTIYVPYPGDAHSDHLETFAATVACTKWFRNAFVLRILCYETVSETDAALIPAVGPFAPNWFVNIDQWIEDKVSIAHIYRSEFGDFPFPRSAEAIRALASVRGVAAGFHAAESFMLIRNRQP